MTPEFKQQKAQAIIEAVQHTAQSLITTLPVAFPPKRPFKRAYGRYRKARQEKRATKAKAVMIPLMGAFQIRNILSQPEPRFKSGIVSVGERGPEIIRIP